MAGKNLSTKENECFAKIRELLLSSNVSSMDDIRNLFKKTKKLQTSFVDVNVSSPNDRKGEFEPQLLMEVFSIALSGASVPDGGILRDAPLSWIIDINQSESLSIAIFPFEIVRKAPVEISFNRRTFIDSLFKLFKIAAEKFDSVRVVYLSVRMHGVFAGDTVLGDNYRQTVAFIEPSGAVAKNFRRDRPICCGPREAFGQKDHVAVNVDRGSVVDVCADKIKRLTNYVPIRFGDAVRKFS